MKTLLKNEISLDEVENEREKLDPVLDYFLEAPL